VFGCGLNGWLHIAKNSAVYYCTVYADGGEINGVDFSQSGVFFFFHFPMDQMAPDVSSPWSRLR
jgi:hypothetical protein